MSKYHSTIEANLTDVDGLIEGLIAFGFKRGEIEVHDSPVNLIGYEASWAGDGGVRKEKAHVVIRRASVSRFSGAPNDIGFERMPSGAFKAHISDNERNHGFNDKFLKGLIQPHAKAVAIKDMAKKGLKPRAIRTLPSGELEMEFA